MLGTPKGCGDPMAGGVEEWSSGGVEEGPAAQGPGPRGLHCSLVSHVHMESSQLLVLLLGRTCHV